jgi:DNA repair protein RadC
MPYEIPVYTVRLVMRDSAITVSDPVIRAGDAARILREYLSGTDREHFVVIMLDVKNQIVGINTVSVGSLSSSIVHPREVFKPAVLSNAHSIILGHNHLSGCPEPSDADKTVTRLLCLAGEALCIRVLDHVIVSGDKDFSFQSHGLI